MWEGLCRPERRFGAPRVGSARQAVNVVMRGILVRLRLCWPRLATQPSLRGATGTEVEGVKKKESKRARR